jgi:spore coat polysaccharide biosynthesis protein SpsF
VKVVAIIQARVGSTRLPGKVLEDIAGEPMLARVVNRTRRAKTLDTVVVATTTETVDDAIIHLCRAHGWTCFRGSEQDLLDRYYQAASACKATAIVRITSDCPLIDPEIIDRVASELLFHYPEVDYASNNLTRTFPRGLDVEAMIFEALQQAWREDRNPAWREHVTPYIYRHPEIFALRNVSSDDIDYSYMRWTVDTPDDLTFVRKIYGHLRNDAFTWREVLHLLEMHPEWLNINRDIQQKMVP